LGFLKVANPVTFHWSACTTPVKWAVMYMWIKGIDFGFVSSIFLLDFETVAFSSFFFKCYQHHSGTIIEQNLTCLPHVFCVSVFVYPPTFHFFCVFWLFCVCCLFYRISSYLSAVMYIFIYRNNFYFNIFFYDYRHTC